MPIQRLTDAPGLLVRLAMTAALAALAFTPNAAEAQRPATKVAVDPVVVETESQIVPVIGRFVARKAGPVAARIAGPVAEYRVDVGDRVEAGDVLAVLVKDRLELAHLQRQADVSMAGAKTRTAQATLKLRRQELDRLESLRRSAAFSQARLDDKAQEVAVAEAEVAESMVDAEAAAAALKLAEIDLSYAEVIAPYAGVVTRRYSEAGAYVAIGAPILDLINDQNLEIEADVPSRNISGLFSGAEIVTRLSEGQQRFRVKVRAIVPNENPQTRTRTVRFTLDPEAKPALGPLAANQTVTLDVPASAGRDVLTVHKDAVLTRQGETVVMIVSGDTAVRRNVSLGDAVGNRMIVTNGLQAGELTVTRGNERLRPGQKVTYDAPASASAPTKPEG